MGGVGSMGRKNSAIAPNCNELSELDITRKSLGDFSFASFWGQRPMFLSG